MFSDSYIPYPGCASGDKRFLNAAHRIAEARVSGIEQTTHLILRTSKAFSVSKGGNIMKRIGIISTSAIFLVVGLVAPAYAQKDDHQDQGKPAQEQQAKPEQQQQHPQAQQSKPAEQPHTQQAQQPKPAQEQHAQQPKPAQQQHAQQPKPTQQQHVQQAQQAKPAQEQHAQQAKPAQQQQAQQNKPNTQQTQQAKQQQHAQQQQHVEQTKQNKSAPQQHPQRSEAQQQRQRSIPELRLSTRTNSRIPDDRFRASFGSSHRFVINQPVIVGGYSRFQYGGFWFGFDQPWPVAWYYTDDVYVDYVDGAYYIFNPYYPGSRVLISVVL
jgi:hypothetical protein